MSVTLTAKPLFIEHQQEACIIVGMFRFSDWREGQPLMHATKTAKHHSTTQRRARAHEAAVRLLLERGAYVNARDHSGMTTLHQVALNSNRGALRTAEALLEKGVDVSALDDRNQTLLSLALDVRVAALLTGVESEARA